jgi:hypothetical protein
MWWRLCTGLRDRHASSRIDIAVIATVSENFIKKINPCGKLALYLSQEEHQGGMGVVPWTLLR